MIWYFLTQEFINDVQNHEPLYNGYHETNDPIFVTCKELNLTKGVPEFKDEIDETDSRWKKLNGELENRLINCNDILKRLSDCTEKMRPMESLLDEIKDLMKAPTRFGGDVGKGKDVKEKIKVACC